MKWYFKVLGGVIILGLLAGLAYLYIDSHTYVRVKQAPIREALSEETIEKLRNSTWGRKIDFDLRGRPEWLLYWLGKYVEYVPNYDPELDDVFRKREDHLNPLAILEFGKGRCEEFSIVYASFLKAAGYDVRVVYDFSLGTSEAGKKNGDHVWVEVDSMFPPITAEKIQQKFEEGVYWTHIDPTEGAIEALKIAENAGSSESFIENKFIDNPKMYERDWKKDVSDAWAILPEECVNVTDRYQWEEP